VNVVVVVGEKREEKEGLFVCRDHAKERSNLIRGRSNRTGMELWNDPEAREGKFSKTSNSMK